MSIEEIDVMHLMNTIGFTPNIYGIKQLKNK